MSDAVKRSRPRFTKAQLLAGLKKCIAENELKDTKTTTSKNNNKDNNKVIFKNAIVNDRKTTPASKRTPAIPTQPSMRVFQARRIALRSKCNSAGQRPRVETLAILLRGVQGVRSESLSQSRLRGFGPSARRLSAISWLLGAVLGSVCVVLWNVMSAKLA